ncbi:MAG: hypothetical protein QM775_31145 [Pirellulales bacterium]
MRFVLDGEKDMEGDVQAPKAPTQEPSVKAKGSGITDKIVFGTFAVFAVWLLIASAKDTAITPVDAMITKQADGLVMKEPPLGRWWAASIDGGEAHFSQKRADESFFLSIPQGAKSVELWFETPDGSADRSASIRYPLN